MRSELSVVSSLGFYWLRVIWLLFFLFCFWKLLDKNLFRDCEIIDMDSFMSPQRGDCLRRVTSPVKQFWLWMLLWSACMALCDLLPFLWLLCAYM